MCAITVARRNGAILTRGPLMPTGDMYNANLPNQSSSSSTLPELSLSAQRAGADAPAGGNAAPLTKSAKGDATRVTRAKGTTQSKILYIINALYKTLEK